VLELDGRNLLDLILDKLEIIPDWDAIYYHAPIAKVRLTVEVID
jgi:hypothetical protein